MATTLTTADFAPGSSTREGDFPDCGDWRMYYRFDDASSDPKVIQHKVLFSRNIMLPTLSAAVFSFREETFNGSTFGFYVESSSDEEDAKRIVEKMIIKQDYCLFLSGANPSSYMRRQC